MKQRFSIMMLLVLLLATLAACGTPAPTASPSPATDTEASPSPATDTEASPSPDDEEASPLPAASPSPDDEEASPSPEASPEASTPATDETPDTGETPGTDTAALPNVGDIDVGTVKMALQAPLSGPQSLFGTTARNGAQLAIQELAEQMGLEVELAEFDDQATESVGASNAASVVADQDILCVNGHINSGVALAALPTYQSANLIMVSPANTNPRITEDFDDTAYRLVGRDDVQGVVAANFAQSQGATNVYVLHDQTAYGEGLATVFRDTAEELGMTVAGFAGTQETSVFDAVLTPIQAANPDLVFYGAIYSTAGPLVQQMRDRGIEARFLGGDGFDSPDLTRLAGEAAVGTNYISVSGPASSYPEAGQFVEQYQSEFNQPASYPAFQAYDATRVCLTAIANAAIEANGRPTREQVKEAAQNIEPFTGVTGRVEFNEEGDRDPATYFIFEVVSGDPEEWGNNEVVDEIDASPPEDD